MIRFLTGNIGWKLLSVVLAVLLWVAIVRDPELATSISAPVLFKGTPQELEISSGLLDSVQLEVRGPAGQLTTDSLSDAAVILDLGNVDRPGDRTYTVEPSNVSLPNGVVFSRAVPAQIRLHFERRMSRDVQVRVRYSSPLPSGYSLAQQLVTPARLRLRGPESNVQQIEHVTTDSIDLSSVVSSAEFQVNTYISDPQVRFESPPLVTVSIQVERTP